MEPELASEERELGRGGAVGDAAVRLPEETPDPIDDDDGGTADEGDRDLPPSGHSVGQGLGGADDEVEDIAGFVGGGAIVAGPVPAGRGPGLVGEGSFADLANVLLEEFATEGGGEHGGKRRPDDK
jgi:hypothetical protein